MKKIYIFKILLLMSLAVIIVGCNSSTVPPDTKHWHGKDYHKIEKGYVPPTQSPGTTRIRHGKNLHEIETTATTSTN